MADSFIPANPAAPNPGTANVETSAIARTDGTVVHRERVVIGDDVNPNAFMSIDAYVRVGRQLAEISMLENQEVAMNKQILQRGNERGFVIDRRGSIGRGTSR